MAVLDELRKEIARYHQRPFLEAAMAVCALAAYADGHVSLSERYRVDALLERMEGLDLFDPHEAVDLLDDYLSRLHRDYESAKTDLMGLISRQGEDRNRARSLLRIVQLVISADGEIADAESEMLREIATHLSIGADELPAVRQLRRD